jgi:hypothetical protein
MGLTEGAFLTSSSSTLPWDDGHAMSVLGLGCVKTPTPAARVENLGAIAHHKSQIILRTNDSMPRKGILFSTFFRCMSFYIG